MNILQGLVQMCFQLRSSVKLFLSVAPQGTETTSLWNKLHLKRNSHISQVRWISCHVSCSVRQETIFHLTVIHQLMVMFSASASWDSGSLLVLCSSLDFPYWCWFLVSKLEFCYIRGIFFCIFFNQASRRKYFTEDRTAKYLL